MSIVGPDLRNGDAMVGPIDTFVYPSNGSKTLFSFPGVTKVEAIYTPGTVDLRNARGGWQSKIPAGFRQVDVTVTCTGLTAQKLAMILEMDATTGGYHKYDQDDLAISSGYCELEGTPVRDLIHMADENNLPLDYIDSGTPDLGQYTVSNSGLTVNNTVDGVNYHGVYYVAHTADGNKMTFDVTKHPARALNITFISPAIDNEDGERFIDGTDADKQSVAYLHIAYAHVVSPIPLFSADVESEVTYDIEISAWTNGSTPGVEVDFIDRTCSPTS